MEIVISHIIILYDYYYLEKQNIFIDFSYQINKL